MNRDEFMRQLTMLLQDISPEERQEALQYYNDYLDDAGSEQEPQVLKELGSPEKVAAIILEGLDGQNDESSEYRETGYADIRFEEKESPQIRGYQNQEKKKEKSTQGQGAYKQQDTYQESAYNKSSYEQYGSSTGYNPYYKKETKKDNTIPKVLLILAIVFIGIPIILPLGLAGVIAIAALLFAFLMLVVGLAIGCVGIAVAGIVLFICGLVSVVTNIAVGFMMMGSGLIMGSLGVMGTVLFVKICFAVVPGLFRGAVELCRKPFHRKVV